MPEIPLRVNAELAQARAKALTDYIYSLLPKLKNEKITTKTQPEDWSALGRMIADDVRVPHQQEALAIIDHTVDLNRREIQLRKLGTGSTFAYISQHFFPYLRRGTVYFVKSILQNDTLHVAIAPAQTVQTEGEIAELVAVQGIDIPSATVRKPLFALKTNLLFDLALAPNIGIEIPIGKRWSIAAEWIFPWWLNTNKQYCMQIMSGNIEGRYWFGNREERPQLTGWFAGVYTGGGYYDLEWKTRGYQGEFFIAAGISGGYAHKIGRNLSLEYSLGIGYLRTKYREYTPEKGVDNEWHLIRQKQGNYTWIGPTQARISLVWMLNHNSRKKGSIR